METLLDSTKQLSKHLYIPLSKGVSSMLILLIPTLVKSLNLNIDDYLICLFFGGFLKFGLEYFVMNNTYDVTIKANWYRLILIVSSVLWVFYSFNIALVSAVGAILQFALIQKRLNGQWGFVPYFFEPLLIFLLFVLSSVSIGAEIIMILFIALQFLDVPFNCKLSLKPLQSLIFTSGTYLNLFLLNIVPLILEVSTEDYYWHSRLAMLVGMSGSFGSLLYQRKKNNFSLNYIRALNTITILILLFIGLVLLNIYSFELIFTFYLGQIFSVLVGPIHYDFYKAGKGYMLLIGVILGFVLAAIMAFHKSTGLLYAGIVFSSGMVVDNLWALLNYKKVDRRLRKI